MLLLERGAVDEAFDACASYRSDIKDAQMIKKSILLLAIVSLAACDGSFTSSAIEGLNIGNTRIIEGRIQTTIANTTDKSADIVLIAKQNGYEICTFVAHMKAHSKNTIEANCGALKSGPVNLVGGWASHFKDEASIAKRIN